MPFRRKILYYGLMLLLTLLAIEGMGRLAYYAAYNQWYGGGWVAAVNLTPPPVPVVPPDSPEYFEPRWIMHPFYGSTAGSPRHDLNKMPPRPRRADTVVIGLLGGSVADDVEPYLQVALNRWFAANELPRRPAVLGLALGGSKQPTQTMIVTNALLLGGEFDLIVNLDGFNELNSGALRNIRPELFPRRERGNILGAELLRAGRLRALRGEQGRRAVAGATSPLRGSALFGLANRYQQERIAAEIIRLNQQLAAPAADDTRELPESRRQRNARRRQAQQGAALQESARLWYRSSVMLARLAAGAGADYYHFLQPNQYVPDSKPLSAWEQEFAWAAGAQSYVRLGYPQLQEVGRDLPSQGINYFDLTGIFADRPETLYRDKCCHLNERGNQLLAAAMIQRMAPALARRGRANPAGPVSLLAAARRPAEPAPPLAPAPAPPGYRAFQVSLSEDGKELRYVREECTLESTDLWFFLHLIPQDLADLPPRTREQGFENQDFVFWRAGGRFEGPRCVAQIRLPEYPIAALRTGQYVPGGQAPLWSVELIIPADPDQLRADYAALAAEEPAARSDFDLYIQDNQLIYLRETCAAADTAAPFFLHIFPEDVTDLPADWQAAGFTHGGFDFARRGGHFDGKCLAAVTLPDYPIKEMRTGQHIPGQGNLWSVRLTAAPDYAQLRADYAALSAEPPVAQDTFDLYILDYRLIYLRETCSVEDTAAPFFLHIVPEDAADLPAERRESGFAPTGFDFAHRGGRFDGKCLAAIALPDYPIKEMRTGQHTPGQGDMWSTLLIAAPDYDQLRADYAALAAAEPAARDYFNLYRRNNRLIYLRETCAAADMAASFFLHIVPEEITDLPVDRRAAGFAHGNFDFVRQGGRFDGKCLAAVALPDYPIAALRTGQYVPGQGDLWSVELVLAP